MGKIDLFENNPFSMSKKNNTKQLYKKSKYECDSLTYRHKMTLDGLTLLDLLELIIDAFITKLVNMYKK